MKVSISIIACALLVSATAGPASAQLYGYPSNNGVGTGSNPSNHYVNPYTTSRGTTVPGHYQSNSNNTQLDNYNTRSNANPYTGAVGTRPPRW